MGTRLRHAWETLTSGYWFVPGLMTAVAMVLAMGMLALDRRVLIPGLGGWVYAGGADGAKTLLASVAGSVITVAGVVFSITVASLTQASSQFGPRLLRNFTRDTGNQVVLGTFVSTFIFCLLVLRSVRGEDHNTFVPHASVTFAVVLAVASIAVLIYFIHHVSQTLQAPRVIANVAAELNAAIERMPTAQRPRAERGEPPELPEDDDAEAACVCAPRDGYVEAVDFGGLVSFAKEHNLVVRLKCRPGDFVIEKNPVAFVRPAGRWKAEHEAKVQGAFILGSQRSSEQDVEYSVRQIVEVAVRALSPGINDPFTAMNGLDALGAGVCRAARRGLPGPYHFDCEGGLRVVSPVTTFEGLVDSSFNQIRQYGRHSVAVSVCLLEVLAACARQCDAHQRSVLLRHAAMTYFQAQESLPGKRDLEDIRERYEAAVRALEPQPGAS